MSDITLEELNKGFYDGALEEEPLLINYTKTKKVFDEAILKAKMFYENIMVDSFYQFATMSNGELYEKEDFGIIYTSSIDCKAYTRNLRFLPSSLDANDKINISEGGLITIAKSISSPGKITKYRYGIMKHNGYVIIPPIYNEIAMIGYPFLMCKKTEYRQEMLRTGLSNDIIENYIYIIDSRGKVRLRIYAPDTRRMETKQQVKIYPSGIVLGSKRSTVIFVISPEDIKTLKKTVTIYVTFGDKIFKFYEGKTNMHKRMGLAKREVNSKGITVDSIDTHLHFTPKEVLEKVEILERKGEFV